MKKYLTFCQYRRIVELSKLQFRKEFTNQYTTNMKAKVVSVAILAVIVLFVLLCVLPLKFVVGICAAVGIFAMFGAMFLMSINGLVRT